MFLDGAGISSTNPQSTTRACLETRSNFYSGVYSVDFINSGVVDLDTQVIWNPFLNRHTCCPLPAFPSELEHLAPHHTRTRTRTPTLVTRGSGGGGRCGPCPAASWPEARGAAVAGQADQSHWASQGTWLRAYFQSVHHVGIHTFSQYTLKGYTPPVSSPLLFSQPR